MLIAVVGAGFTGLSAAYFLSQKGHRVTILEKSPYSGGITSGFKKPHWDWYLESYFHHLFPSDKAIITLMRRLGLSQKLLLLEPKTSIFLNGTLSQFDSPLSLWQFPYLSFPEKIKAGLVTAYLKFFSGWQKFDRLTARRWLKSAYGERTYRLIWEPLLKGKFGRYHSLISMAWFWARIKKRTRQLAYIEGGFQVLINKLLEEIRKKGGKILFNQNINSLTDIERRGKFDRIIFTTPADIFANIARKKLPDNYRRRCQSLQMLGAINLLLILKRPFLTDGTYWLNVNEAGFPFIAVVEHTNFIDPKYYGGDYLVYVGGYYPPDHHYFSLTVEDILREYMPYLKKINPRFNQSSITGSRITISKYAQPITPPNYSQKILPYKTPLPGVFLANMQQIYPYDRGTNYAVEMGKKIAEIVNYS